MDKVEERFHECLLEFKKDQHKQYLSDNYGALDSFEWGYFAGLEDAISKFVSFDKLSSVGKNYTNEFLGDERSFIRGAQSVLSQIQETIAEFKKEYYTPNYLKLK